MIESMASIVGKKEEGPSKAVRCGGAGRHVWRGHLGAGGKRAAEADGRLGD